VTAAARTRAPIDFPEWQPVRRDAFVSYSYVLPSTGRTIRGQDRWMRGPWRLAAACLHGGATEFTVRGGVGTRAWVRTVTCTEEQADAWFREQIAKGHFMLKGEYRKALAGQARRMARA
jgi:hypothetical protein